MIRYSFITCTYNRDKYLANTLKSLCEQDFPTAQFELIIVNNNSTDQTADVCSAIMGEHHHLHIRYIVELEQGLSFALNRGIKEAKGEYIIYVDDDETLKSTYLNTLNDYLTDHPFIEMAASRVIPVYETKKPKWLSHFTMRLMTGAFSRGDSLKLLDTNNYPGTGHTIIKREVYDKTGAYNTDLGRKGGSLIGAEDKDMCMRLDSKGVKCYYLPKLAIYHHIPDSKLTDAHFNKLTYSIGQSERMRTLANSKGAYIRRLMEEVIKWGVSCMLLVIYTLLFSPRKGWKLIQFRWNVSKGLLGY